MTPRRAAALLAVAAHGDGDRCDRALRARRSSAKATVTATDFKFKVLPARLTAGVATFTVVNRGEATHDFKIAGKKTRILNPASARP